MATAPRISPLTAAPVLPENLDGEDGMAMLARSWNQAAHGYDDYFVPRFAPWLTDAIDALPLDLPAGVLVVPCCGTGPELPVLAARYPGRQILGIDLASGMLACAAERTRHVPNVVLREADASDTTGWPSCAAVLSLFGLQQLPRPATALGSWMRALVPGGVLSVVFWPFVVEDDGPFAWFRAALGRHMVLPAGTWEGELTEAISLAGGRLHDDCELQHGMRHASAADFLDAVLDTGPGQMLIEEHGAAWADTLRREFLATAPQGPITHTPSARLLLARR